MRSETRHISLCAVIALTLLTSGLAYADNIYVSCYDFYNATTVEKIDSSGNRTTFASGLYGPTGLAFDKSNNLYVAESRTKAIYKYDSSGNKSLFSWGIQSLQGLAFDKSGNLDAASFNDGMIYQIKPSGGTGSIIASGLGDTEAIAFDSIGNIFVSDYMRHVYKIDKNGKQSVFAYCNNPVGLAFDSSGYLYVAQYGDGTIEKFNSTGNGTIFASGLNAPIGLAFDSKGYLYVANAGSGTIERFNSTGNSSIIASGLTEPLWIATQVPEPATLLLLGLGGVILRRKHQRAFEGEKKDV